MGAAIAGGRAVSIARGIEESRAPNATPVFDVRAKRGEGDCGLIVPPAYASTGDITRSKFFICWRRRTGSKGRRNELWIARSIFVGVVRANRGFD